MLFILIVTIYNVPQIAEFISLAPLIFFNFFLNFLNLYFIFSSLYIYGCAMIVRCKFLLLDYLPIVEKLTN